MNLRNLTIILLLGFAILSCNNEQGLSKNPKGIGPVDSLELELINDSLMKTGLNLFKNKCSQCHTMEYKNEGPDISDILAVRKPEWVVNFLLNKEEMILRDAAAVRTRVKYKKDCGSNLTQKNEALELSKNSSKTDFCQ
jgi:cytochrome c1